MVNPKTITFKPTTCYPFYANISYLFRLRNVITPKPRYLYLSPSLQNDRRPLSRYFFTSQSSTLRIEHNSLLLYIASFTTGILSDDSRLASILSTHSINLFNFYIINPFLSLSIIASYEAKITIIRDMANSIPLTASK